MRTRFLPLLAAVLALLSAGCATSTIESRRQERFASYTGLTPEFQQLVDRGQIKVGMNSDAVFIAWGPPSDIIEREDSQGHWTIWIYHGQSLQEARYWTYREVWHDGYSFIERFPVSDYYSVGYVRAEIVFFNGKVHEWRTLPKPPG